MNKTILFFLCFLFGAMLSAQDETLYRVYFTDKGEQIELLNRPHEFLSGKAIWRRTKHHIAIDKTDLPLSTQYLSALSEKGFEIKTKSKWLNYAVVKNGDISQLQGLPFIKKVEHIKPMQVHFADVGCSTQMINYGNATTQVEMLNGNQLHDFGFTGAGITIAVLDGGFFNALPTTNGFDSLYSKGQILGSYNFVGGDTNVFQGGFHGTLVLSVMGGFVQDQFVGAAPDASYWLLKSENESSERTIEMDNWVRAAEFADSVGADVINSSLGYSTFDGGVGDLSPEDMDGNTAVVTIGADMAAKKGILVVASAGNSGTSISWPIIAAPADGDSVLAVGGVDANENYVSFSSRGPSADGRIKPDVVAMAQSTAFVRQSGVVGSGNGTSFSSPLIAGFAACLWQSKPSLSNMEISQAIKNTASHAYTPNNNVGFGLPDFAAASYSIAIAEQKRLEPSVNLYPNPAQESITLNIQELAKTEALSVSWFDLTGREIQVQHIKYAPGALLEIKTPAASGMYLVRIASSSFYSTHEVVVE